MPLSNYEICLLHWVQYHVCLLGRVDTLPMFIIIIINFMLLVSLFLSYTPFNYILLSLVAIYSTNYSFFPFRKEHMTADDMEAHMMLSQSLALCYFFLNIIASSLFYPERPSRSAATIVDDLLPQQLRMTK
jgi:hypothetical protein